MLSGHVHGGIVRLPFLGGVISPAIRLFPLMISVRIIEGIPLPQRLQKANRFVEFYRIGDWAVDCVV